MNHHFDAAQAKARTQAQLRRGMYLLPSLFTAGNLALGYFSITQTIDAISARRANAPGLGGHRHPHSPFPSTRSTGASPA